MNKIDKTNMNWVKSLSDYELYNKIFSCAYLIQTNQHLEIFQDLRDKLLSTYEVIAEFTHLGYNGDSIICNDQKLVIRRDKFKPVTLGKNVTLLNGKFASQGGSNKWPSIGYKGQTVRLKFISYGLPVVDDINGWNIKVIELNKIL